MSYRTPYRLSLLVICLLCIASLAMGERLVVVHIKGEITNNGVPLRVGSELEYTDDLELGFSSIYDETIVVSPEKGRYIITARKFKVTDGAIRVLVRDNFLPCPILRPAVDAESTGIEELLGDGRLSLLDSIMLPLNPAYVSSHPNHYFLLSYSYDGEKMRKKIFIDPDFPYLTISNSLFSSNREIIDPSLAENIELYVYDAVKNQAKKLSTLKITSLLSEETVQELRVLVNNIRAYTHDDRNLMVQEVRSHIEEFYGQVKDSTVERYLRMLAGM